MKKILFSDMDGTVIDGNQLLSNKDLEMLCKMRAAGHLVVFCTGRNHLEAMTAIEQHKLPYDYLILNNGSHIICNNGVELFKRTIPQELGLKILNFCINLKDYYVYFYNAERNLNCGILNGVTMGYDGDSYTSLDTQFMEEAGNAADFDIISIKPLNPKQSFSKLVGISNQIHDAFGRDVEITLNASFLDLTPIGQTKGTGLCKLVSLLNEDFETYCIGDSYNDISMFQSVKYSYTFNRCSYEIKKEVNACVDYVYEAIDDILR